MNQFEKIYFSLKSLVLTKQFIILCLENKRYITQYDFENLNSQKYFQIGVPGSTFP